MRSRSAASAFGDSSHIDPRWQLERHPPHLEGVEHRGVDDVGACDTRRAGTRRQERTAARSGGWGSRGQSEAGPRQLQRKGAFGASSQDKSGRPSDQRACGSTATAPARSPWSAWRTRALKATVAGAQTPVGLTLVDAASCPPKAAPPARQQLARLDGVGCEPVPLEHGEVQPQRPAAGHFDDRPCLNRPGRHRAVVPLGGEPCDQCEAQAPKAVDRRGIAGRSSRVRLVLKGNMPSPLRVHAHSGRTGRMRGGAGALALVDLGLGVGTCRSVRQSCETRLSVGRAHRLPTSSAGCARRAGKDATRAGKYHRRELFQIRGRDGTQRLGWRSKFTKLQARRSSTHTLELKPLP